MVKGKARIQFGGNKVVVDSPFKVTLSEYAFYLNNLYLGVKLISLTWEKLQNLWNKFLTKWSSNQNQVYDRLLFLKCKVLKFKVFIQILLYETTIIYKLTTDYNCSYMLFSW